MPVKIQRAFGRLSIPDARDNEYPIRRTAGKRKSRTWYAKGWWGDQRTTPRCVAYAWLNWVSDCRLPRGSRAPYLPPGTLYHEAQQMDDWPGTDYDGTTVRAGAAALVARGILTEYCWARTAADIVSTLLERGPLVVGTTWKLGMSTPDARGRIRVEGPDLGGHAYMLNAIDLPNKRLRIKNNWGPQYGQNGHAWVDLGAWLELWDREDGEACWGGPVTVPPVRTTPAG